MATPATILREVKQYLTDEREALVSALLSGESDEVLRGRAQMADEILKAILEGEQNRNDNEDI